MANVESLPCDVALLSNWRGFAVFMAATLWLSAIGVAAFYVRAYITRRESTPSGAKKERTNAAHAGHSATHHGPNGHPRD